MEETGMVALAYDPSTEDQKQKQKDEKFKVILSSMISRSKTIYMRPCLKKKFKTRFSRRL